MAAPRNTPKKPSAKKPVGVTRTAGGQFVKSGIAPATSVARDVVKPAGSEGRETVIRRANVIAQPSPVELRAEREPAVNVAVSTAPRATRSVAEDNDDWAVPPQQLNWWQRVRTALWNRGGKQDEANESMAEHMAVVKAGVLQELETMGAKKGIAVKGSPFATVMLPVATRKRNWKWPVLGLLALVPVGMMVWVGSKPEAPEAVLGQAIAAARNHDVRTFEAKVDVASVATSLVNQMFNVPEGAGNAMAAKMTAFAKPGLADSLKDEILAAVGGETLDDSGNTLLGKLWHAMGAEKVRLGAARVAMQDPHLAVAELTVLRTDLDLSLPLQVVLTQGSGGHAGWQVVDMPNLAAVLGTITAAENAMAERRAQAGLPENIRIESVKKAKDGGAGSSNLMVSMVLGNTGATDVRDVQLELAFGDAAGQPMMTTRVTLDGVLAAGTKREQVWSIPIDRKRAAERYVVDLPLSALTVVVSVVK